MTAAAPPVAVASGHPATTAAAIEVLEAAATRSTRVAGGLRGGGRRADPHQPGGRRLPAPARWRARRCCSTSSWTPRPGRPAEAAPLDFDEVVVQFSGAEQGFNVGLGSVAVPGCLAGWLHAHRRLGRVPLAVVPAPPAASPRRGWR